MAYPLLLEWYDANRRVLPFRGTRDPYAVWISEIMLQQTRTDTVRGYYTRFLNRFPNIAALAQADEQEVLKYWEGLGYYSRARNLKRAAGILVREYGGNFPESYAALRALPGIGEYTAGAIASICFDLPTPAIDGKPLINRENIAKMKDGVIIINNSRGQMVVEQDLADALNSGKVAFAGLDVVSTEPIRADNPLLKAKNCIITPHMSWGSRGSRQRIMDCTVSNVQAFLNGAPENVVNR